MRYMIIFCGVWDICRYLKKDSPIIKSLEIGHLITLLMYRNLANHILHEIQDIKTVQYMYQTFLGMLQQCWTKL